MSSRLERFTDKIPGFFTIPGTRYTLLRGPEFARLFSEVLCGSRVIREDGS
jgi:hypothetical protein